MTTPDTPSPHRRARHGAVEQDRRRRLLLYASVLVLVAAALALRTYALNAVPPFLWWDEATQGLDARDLLHGRFQVFFPRAEGKEPLYIYLTAPLVAVWDGEPFATRLAGGLLGALMAPLLFFTARSLWFGQRYGAWVGLAAAAFWVTSYWALSMNRIGFQVNALPPMLTLAVLAWTNWTRKPDRRRALVFGLAAGLTLCTYLAARITPILWVLLYVTLTGGERKAANRSVLWAVAGFLLCAAPVGIYLALNPDVASNRVDVFPLLSEPGDSAAWAGALSYSLKMVAGVFVGLTGDPILRHNIPNRPPVSAPLAVLFLVGTGLALLSLRHRDRRGWTLLLWLGVLAIPGVLGIASNPHFPRLFGALPAALLLAAWGGVALAAPLLHRGRLGHALVAAVLVLLVVFEGVRTAQAYFVTWPGLDLAPAFEGDLWTVGEAIATEDGAVGVVPMHTEDGLVLDYGFARAPLLQVRDGDSDIERWLADHLGEAGGRRVLTPVWLQAPFAGADPKGSVPFFLEREGEQTAVEALPTYRLETYVLGPQPQFAAAGQQATLQQDFESGVRLESAAWGGAYPNPDRSAAAAEAGTGLWVILTWHLERAFPGLRATVDLSDGQGHRLDLSDAPVFVSPEGDAPLPQGPLTLRSYHLVKTSATQPAGELALTARAYDAQRKVFLAPAGGDALAGVAIGTAAVTSPARPAEIGDIAGAVPFAAAFPGGVSLAGYDAPPAIVAPGTTVPVRLYWRIDEQMAQPAAFEVRLGETGAGATSSVAPAPVGGVVHTYADMALPPDLPPGRYALSVAPADGSASPVEAAEIEVGGRVHRFDLPALSHPLDGVFGGQVALAGLLDAPPVTERRAGETVALDLVWQALATPQADLVRFVHVVAADGRVVAQQDAVPCSGECPSRSWLPGEVLVDRAEIVLPANLPPGEYGLAAGWYEAQTQQRLAGRDGAGAALAADLAPLPVMLRVE